MSTPDVTEPLDPRWQQRVREIGKRNFENEEMLRLGFIGPEAEARIAAAQGSKLRYKELLKELAIARGELAEVNAQLPNANHLERLICEIRARRIERVRLEAAERKVKKQERDQLHRDEWARQKESEPVFLGRGVSARLAFHGGDPEKLARRNLPAVETFTQLANELELTTAHLQWLAYDRVSSESDHYSRFEIPKRAGGVRRISSPKPAMRSAQQWIRERILQQLPVHAAAMAFRPGTSIVDNARLHAGAALVVRIDLKEFFPTITFVRVRGFFESLGYNPGVATVLALVCTDAPRARVTMDGLTRHVAIGERSLPQGACTSPDLANLVSARLDARLTGLAGNRSWTYTRYADDLVFSTSSLEEEGIKLVRAVSRICLDEGFTVNVKKTRIMRQPNRQMVTGLMVNDEVRLTRRDLKRIRSFLHHCETRGFEEVSNEIGKDARSVARGYYAYVHMVMPQTAALLRERHSWL